MVPLIFVISFKQMKEKWAKSRDESFSTLNLRLAICLAQRVKIPWSETGFAYETIACIK
jgi:hypothetical protein